MSLTFKSRSALQIGAVCALNLLSEMIRRAMQLEKL